MFPLNKATLIIISVLASAVLVGCSADKNEQSAPAMRAPTVSVAEVVSLRLSEWDEFSGRLSAPETVTLIPRISGYIERVLFTEGTSVKEGQVLLQIDPAPFQAEVERLQAQLTSAKSRVDLARSEFERGKTLIGQNAISQEALDNRHAAVQQADADAAAIKAALKRAELDLSYTRVKAPISGRVSRAQITQGNYVTAGQSELTHIVSTSKMYAYFNVDEQTYLNYVRDELTESQSGMRQPVSMALAGDTAFGYSGYIDFIDNQVSEQTGSITLRATFDNPNRNLMPGLYARVRLAGTPTHDGILIDEKAIGTDLNNKFVLVVGEGNIVEYRPVKLGESLGDLRIVKAGLESGDNIIISGLQRVMPGIQITPDVTTMANPAAIAAIETAQRKLDQKQIALTASYTVLADQ
ncbi:efflux transporter periplasmic adaptor subunit [Alteromonas alba]|uniref:Efflux transporter periplasmic adaptor subunit n=1 Tax=Alteromonas alba TaxID=2079529 RepID=A0A2S9VFB8_9ALTE|nr:efflux RND transporter periplasmic adaptor subunit [Alteromonas alba]PRO74995.1 efflux transporter periplasmic adaptor subunit [Alteromonas alba]